MEKGTEQTDVGEELAELRKRIALLEEAVPLIYSALNSQLFCWQDLEDTMNRLDRQIVPQICQHFTDNQEEVEERDDPEREQKLREIRERRAKKLT